MAIKIRNNIEKYRQWLDSSGNADELDAMLDDNVVFTSPALEDSKLGRVEARRFILAARAGMKNEHFRYLREFTSDTGVVIEYATKIGDIDANGAIFIEWNATNKIVDFKTMLRPLSALNALYAHMKTMLNAEN